MHESQSEVDCVKPRCHWQEELAREGALAGEQRASLCGFVTHLERILDEGGDHFDPVNISTAMHALGSTVGDPDLSSDARSGNS